MRQMRLWQRGAAGLMETQGRALSLVETLRRRMGDYGGWTDFAAVAVAFVMLLLVLAAAALSVPKASEASRDSQMVNAVPQALHTMPRDTSRDSSISRKSHAHHPKNERKSEAAFEADVFREGQPVRARNEGELWKQSTVVAVSDGHGSSLLVAGEAENTGWNMLNNVLGEEQGNEYDCVEPVSEAISVYRVICVDGLNISLCPHAGSHTVASIRQGADFKVYSHMVYKGVMKMLTKDGWASAFDDVTRMQLVTRSADGAQVGCRLPAEVPNIPQRIDTRVGTKVAHHQCCCPELIVPEQSECVLFIPKLPFYKHSGHIVVEDTQGMPIFSVRCVLPPGGLHSLEEDLHIMLSSADNTVLFARAQRGINGGIDIHSCRGRSPMRSAMSANGSRMLCLDDRGKLVEHHGQEIDGQQVFFGSLMREAHTSNAADWSGAYAFTSATGSVLRVHGNSKEGLINATDAAGHLLATAEFNRAGPRKGWRFLRVGPNVDSGLILLLVLSVNVLVFEAMSGHEARTAAQREMYTELDKHRANHGNTTRRPR